jgi:hypothetical protein
VVDVSTWANCATVKEWWLSFTSPNGSRRKWFASLIMVAYLEIWNERNARVFRNVAFMFSLVVYRIKSEASLWSLAGAKHLGSIMPWEWLFCSRVLLDL